MNDKEGDGLNVPQHLYVISYDQIEEGDWILKDNKQYPYEIVQVKYFGDFGGRDKKIVATTDINLVSITPIPNKYDLGMGTPFLYGKLEGNSEFTMLVPQISEVFINEYVKSNGSINEVQVEMEYKWMDYHKNKTEVEREFCYCYEEIKTREDNTVIIYPKEKSWDDIWKEFYSWAKKNYPNTKF